MKVLNFNILIGNIFEMYISGFIFIYKYKYKYELINMMHLS